MKSIVCAFGMLPRAALTIVCVGSIGSSLMAAEHERITAGPADISAAVPATSYQSVLPGTERAYLRRTDVDRLPWRQLFDPDGDFSPQVGALGVSARKEKVVTSTERQAQTTTSASDARGVVKSIDRERGRVKLKHGAIERLEMPGMTMVFRVKDPALLDHLKEGDTVGFTVEVEGGKFFITDFQE